MAQLRRGLDVQFSSTGHGVVLIKCEVADPMSINNFIPMPFNIFIRDQSQLSVIHLDLHGAPSMEWSSKIFQGWVANFEGGNEETGV